MQGYAVVQADLGIELINKIFSRSGFHELFSLAKTKCEQLSPNSLRIIQNEEAYAETVDLVMRFLQYQDNTLAQRICSDHFLPRASRFDQMPDLEWCFGSMGVNDTARFLATRYVEDVGDLIKDAVTPYFGFSRYAEKLGLSAHSFAPLNTALQQPENIIERWMLELLETHMKQHAPDVVGITLPFPGNLYAGLKCGQYIKKKYPHVMIIAGGGFVNTELRELAEPALFDYLDFVTLDDGERPFLNILKFLQNELPVEKLKRTFLKNQNTVQYVDDAAQKDFSQAETGCPDYSDLQQNNYLSLIEIANPMHRLWSDGRWNKLTIAHGCYWHKCSFCDISLDYIKRFEAVPTNVLVDRIERVSAQTGQRGFHFVDEAAPPALLKALALELLRRKISISWWANIRFEDAFDQDLCRLLAASGCIAVTGGLEAASDRLLKLMNKGVTISQAARACRNFSEAGILVHAYLMYGFPTQTKQETIDALEIVRQFFQEGLVQSAFWHLFSATVHSDVGMHPQKYGCRLIPLPKGSFAKNDIYHEDKTGCDPTLFSSGLNKAIYNFMHGIGTDFPIQDWFDFRVPKVSVKRHVVQQAIAEQPLPDADRMQAKLLWLENLPIIKQHDAKQNKQAKASELLFYTKTEVVSLQCSSEITKWLLPLFEKFSASYTNLMTLAELQQSYEQHFTTSFSSFLKSREWKTLREKGLLLI